MASIEWLINQLNKQGFAQVVTDEEIKQAQAMHHQEILAAYKEGQSLRFDDNINYMAEQYYKETFKTTKDGFVYLTDAPLMFNKKSK